MLLTIKEVESCHGWPSLAIEGGWAGGGDNGPVADNDEAADETRGDGLPEVEAEGEAASSWEVDSNRRRRRGDV
jgi:hypothetical protein